MTIFLWFIIIYGLVRKCACKNWALYKPAEQSSTLVPYTAHKAVDGNNNSDLYENSCSHTTAAHRNPFWIVDLQTHVTVKAVGIIPRSDCCPDRSSRLHIDVGRVKTDYDRCLYRERSLALKYHLLKCDTPVRGRYVRIRRMGYVLELCEVFVLGYEKGLTSNWALGRPASQSSVQSRNGAKNAVDGYQSINNISAASCSQTSSDQSNPSWIVNLENDITVTSVAIVNRGDCCGDLLRDFYVEVLRFPDDSSPKLCFHYEAAYEQGNLTERACDVFHRGRYVRIRKETPELTLCEVIVKGTKTSTVNWALGRPARQSSTSREYTPSKAVDGYNVAKLNEMSCSQTSSTDLYPWWIVDLQNDVSVTEVGILNRGDCCGDELNKIFIEIMWQDKKTFYKLCNYVSGPIPSGKLYIIKCVRVIRGRAVKITKVGPHLTICEVEVFGTRKDTYNLALGRPANQSSTHRNYSSDKAVDGYNYTDLDFGTCSHTSLSERNPWWMVDLETTTEISAVGILNRGDCCGEKLKNFKVEVLRVSNETDPNICISRREPLPQGKYTELKCETVHTGRFVRITKEEPGLALCEVYVLKPIKKYAQWTSWEEVEKGGCSVTCYGNGKQNFYFVRNCISNGMKCSGDKHKVVARHCPGSAPCPVNGRWSSWTEYRRSECSVTCESGTKKIISTRECNRPIALYGGKPCEGKSTKVNVLECDTSKHCPVDGGWNTWTVADTFPCTVTCLSGIYGKVLTRQCTNPEPLYGGKSCYGYKNVTVSEPCYTNITCPVHGGWGSWEMIDTERGNGTCAVAIRKEFYRRECNNPEPYNGGIFCVGENEKIQTALWDTRVQCSRTTKLSSPVTPLTLGLGGAIILVMFALFVYSIVRRRKKPVSDNMDRLKVQDIATPSIKIGDVQYFPA